MLKINIKSACKKHSIRFVRLFNVPLHLFIYVYGVHQSGWRRAASVPGCDCCLQGPHLGEGKNPSPHFCAYTGPKMLAYMPSPNEIRNNYLSVHCRSDRRRFSPVF